MTTQPPPAAAALRSLLAPLLLGAVLVVPFAFLELVNRWGYREDFPYVLFAFMSVHALAIALLLTPGLRRLWTARRLAALTPRHWAGLVLAGFVGWAYAGVIMDQLPCFLGVLNCD
jgi:hypothetical protein